MHFWKITAPVLILLTTAAAVLQADDGYRSWTLDEAARVLNGSPWSYEETYTRIVGGIGSGIQGEKEIYSTYFVRLLSAQPVRQAYARIRQIQMGYDALDPAGKLRIDSELGRIVNLDVSDWIVVAVTFRCNEPREEARINRFFANGTSETVRQRSFLSTGRHPRILLAAYYPPRESAVGARFVFPRTINGEPVIGEADQELVFELDTPSSSSDLRAVFRIADLQLEGKREL
jgi:hypothetical protein